MLLEVMQPKQLKPIIEFSGYLQEPGRVTKWLCGGLQIRLRGFKSLPAL